MVNAKVASVVRGQEDYYIFITERTAYFKKLR